MTGHYHTTGIDPSNHRRRTGPWCPLSIVILLMLGGAPAAAAAEELDKILARPISTGSIALLWEHASTPAAHDRLREALKDSRPEVRAVAARIAHNSKMQALLHHLQAALKAETDPLAAAELVRAVLVVGGRATYATAVTAALRVGGEAALAVVETFARLGSRELLTHLESLAPYRVPHDVLAKAIVAVTKGDDAARLALLRTPVVTGNRPLLVNLLSQFRAEGTVLPPDLLITWLQGEEVLRLEAIWQIALMIKEGGPSVISGDVLSALAPRVDATPREVSWEAFGLELIARMTSKERPTTTKSWRELPYAQPATTSNPVVLADFDVLTDAERGDISEALFGTRDRLSRPTVMPSSASRTRSTAKPLPVIVSAPPIRGSLWPDLYAITRCKPTRTTRMALAEISYHPDGRPRKMGVDIGTLPAGCESMVRALFSLNLPRLTEPAATDYLEVALIPFDETAIACAGEGRWEWPDADARADASKRPRITPPKKTHDVRPLYSESAQRDRVQGPVLIDTIISPTGCVVTGRVIRGVEPRLDIEALLAVMSWRYKPGLLEDRPVPVVMTVTVNFTLQ